MDIVKIYNTLTKLEKESARTVKEQILKDNKGDDDFLKALSFLLNPYIVTGISTKKMKKKINSKNDAEIPSIRTFEEMIDYLTKNNSGRDLDILAVKEYADQFESIELYKFILKFATKDIKLGISEKTVNKIYGANTIPTFAVMLAESYAKKSDKVTGKFYITLKLDGNRCVAVNDENGVKFFTRKGQPIDGMTQLEEEFARLPKGYVYDGELLLVNKDGLPSDELFRATQKVVRKDGEKKDLEFNIFDLLTISEFKNGKSKKTYEQRRNNLNLLGVDSSFKFISVLPVLYTGTDKSVIPAYAKAVEDQGYEGLMINTADGLYQTKRVVDLLKVKSFKSADGVIMGTYEGTGKNEGKLGGILITYKDKAVKIGSGFTDEERDNYWNNPDLIVGKIGQYNYFEESQNQNGGYDLRFATWKGLREDKTIDDVNYE